jgi:acetylornithine deacetylase/succinyl-diaminopimelate desuccinylase family protein
MTDWLARALAAVDVEAVIRLTGDLVHFPSVTPPGSEEAIARFLAERFHSRGLAVELQEVAPGRFNAIGRLGPAGGRPHLVLNGHLDVMPDGEGWSLPPFEPTQREGRLYGRGSADMKGGLAAMICAVEAVVAAQVPLEGTITLAAVADEEGYQAGTRHFVESAGPADFGIVAEPTNLRPATAQKGDVYLEVTTRGRSAHASVPEAGHNAIDDMALILAALEDLRVAFGRRPAHPLLGHPTLSAGTISGGTVTPVVPDHCRITIDRRVLPGEDIATVAGEVQEMIARLHARHSQLDATVRVLWAFPPSEIAADEPIVRAVQEATRHVAGVWPVPFGLTGTTDANLMIDPGGIPTVIFGPGDLAVCHKPDEFVPIDELVTACKIYVATILRLLQTGVSGGGHA